MESEEINEFEATSSDDSDLDSSEDENEIIQGLKNLIRLEIDTQVTHLFENIKPAIADNIEVAQQE